MSIEDLTVPDDELPKKEQQRIAKLADRMAEEPVDPADVDPGLYERAWRRYQAEHEDDEETRVENARQAAERENEAAG